MFPARSINRFVLIFLLCACYPASSYAEKESLAIFNFRPVNIEAMEYNTDILFALISVLEKDKTVELMPRRKMEDLLSHAGMGQGDNTDAVLKSGKVLGAHFILFGQVAKTAGKIESKLKLMDIRRQRLVHTWTLSFNSRDAVLSRIQAFAPQLIRAVNTGRSAAGSASAKQPGSRKTGIQWVKAKSQGNQIVLTWKTEPGISASGFHVYRSDQLKGPFQFIGKVDKNIFFDSTFERGKIYFYRIGRLLPSGKEAKSDQIAEIKNAGEKMPHPPLIMSGKGMVGRTEIKFVPSLKNGAEGFKIGKYKIYRKRESGQVWEHIQTIDADNDYESDITFTVKDKKKVKDGMLYDYAVSSLDQKNRESPLSDVVAIKTVHRPVLSVKKDHLLRKVDLTWPPLKQVEGYGLYRKINRTEWQQVKKISGGDKTAVTDESELEDGRVYEYYLTAFDDDGETGPSNQVTAKTKPPPPCPRSLMVESGLVKSVKITWEPVDDPDIGGYALYRKTKTTKPVRIAQVDGYQSDTYVDKGGGFTSLEDGKDYYYSLKSYNLFEAEGDPTPFSRGRTKPRPGKAKGLVALAAKDHIRVKWEKNAEPDIKSYTLYRNRNDGYWSEIEIIDSDRTSYIDKNIKPRITYRYKVIVTDRDDLESDSAESEAVLSPLAEPKT